MSRPSLTKQELLTAERAREIFSYDPMTGQVRRRITLGRRMKAGALVGSPSSSGYLQLGYEYKKFQLHRVIWLYVYGTWPTHFIDHINGVRDDNRLANLREADDAQNAANSAPKYGRPFKGVIRHSRRRWTAQIHHAGQNIYLGSFKSPEDASAAYASKARELKGEFARW